MPSSLFAWTIVIASCGLPKRLIQRLQRIQNTAARLVTRTNLDDHITSYNSAQKPPLATSARANHLHSPVNVRSKMTQPRRNCNIIYIYGNVFRKHSGNPEKKSTKI